MGVKEWRFRRVLLLAVGTFALVGVAAAHSIAFVRVKVETANVRGGPGTQFDRRWQAYENYPLKVVGRRGDWLKTVDFEGYEGWLHAPLTDRQPAVVVKREWANIRSGPGTNHPVAFTAERGVAFLLLGTRGNWLKVEHADGDDGWIHKSLVWGTD
ncbi:MAG: SH3 domain-containing protein [Candidatus Rokubacteria bacterium]|nr:SH3 domain-containing protein [Candidatus Rokubacteria bacterium]